MVGFSHLMDCNTLSPLDAVAKNAYVAAVKFKRPTPKLQD
jgi:hypothetical protein